MNQAQEMLKNMLIMTINDVKAMHGLDHSDIATVLTAVHESPAITDTDTDNSAAMPAADEQAAPVVEDGKTVSIADVDTVVIEDADNVDDTRKKPAKKAAAKKK